MVIMILAAAVAVLSTICENSNNTNCVVKEESVTAARTFVDRLVCFWFEKL